MLTRVFPEALEEIIQKIRNDEAFAISRFGDGEASVLLNRSVKKGRRRPGFQFRRHDAEDQFCRQRLLESFQFRHPQYYVGVPCECCQPRLSTRVRALPGLADAQLTWATVFTNANYGAFKSSLLPLMKDRSVYLVCHNKAVPQNLPFSVAHAWRVSRNAWRDDYGVIEEVKQYVTEHHIAGAVFLFAAGPLANLLCHQLFAQFPGNTYLDIGSPLDPYLFGPRRGRTRFYLKGRPQLKRVCIWTNARPE